jgi:hypothetical protein
LKLIPEMWEKKQEFDLDRGAMQQNKLDSRSQFYQHFTHSFFVRKLPAKLFSAWSIG